MRTFTEPGRFIQRFTNRQEICEWVITYQGELIDADDEDAEEIIDESYPIQLEQEITLLGDKDGLESWLSEKIYAFLRDHVPEPAARDHTLKLTEICTLYIAAEEIDIEYSVDWM